MHEGPSAPRGWYPAGEGERYWDGQAWTPHTRPSHGPTGDGDGRPRAPPQRPERAVGTGRVAATVTSVRQPSARHGRDTGLLHPGRPEEPGPRLSRRSSCPVSAA